MIFRAKNLKILQQNILLGLLFLLAWSCKSEMDLKISGAVATPVVIYAEDESDDDVIPTPEPTATATPTPEPTPTPAITFDGIDSIDDITDTTLTINWTHHGDAVSYTLYDTTSNPFTVVALISPPAIEYIVTDLTPGTLYSFRLRAENIDGIKDANTNDVDETTSAQPAAPTLLTLITPATATSSIGTPTIEVAGVKNGDTVKLYSDIACTPANEIGSAVASGATVQITTQALDTDAYTIYAQATNPHADVSPCSTANLSYTRACPDGYILVPPNPTVGTTVDFCVMKYEAKAWNDSLGNSDGVVDVAEVDSDGCQEGGCTTANWASIYANPGNLTGYRPVSVVTGKPWRRISQANAIIACANLGTGYALISNPEWMTIARNIEVQDVNWSNGTVGDGHLARGHSDNSPSEPCDGAFDNVEGSCSIQGVTFNQNRTHELSNSEVIWDFAGNIWEWAMWIVTPANKAYVSANGAPVGAFREFNALDTNINNGDEMESITWEATNSTFSSTENIGQYYAGLNTTGGGVLRSGAWSNIAGSGIFSLHIGDAPTHTWSSISFRCVYHP